MKKLLYFVILVLFCGTLTSCEDEDKLYHPKTEDTPLVIPKINQQKNAFIIDTAAGTSSEYAFRIDLDARGVNVAAVEVYKTYNGANLFTPRVLHTRLTSFPAEVNVPLSEAIQGFEIEDDSGVRPLQISDIVSDDVIIFTFEVVRSDGRRIIYTPVDADGFLIGGSQIFEPFAAWAPIVVQ